MSGQYIDKYGFSWSEPPDDLHVEFNMIRYLYHTDKKPQLLEHYLNAHKLLWPEDSQHRWFVLGMKSMIENQVSIFMGCASSGKTYLMACHALIDFFCFPRTSLALISSTEKRSLEIKVFGRVKELFNRAKSKFDWIEGFVLDSAMSITPDETDEENEFGREMNKGIICVPCVSGGRFVGMGKFQGAKAPNTPGKFDGILKHYGDEAGVMFISFLDAYSNWTVSPNFKGVISGNPTDISDPLCIAGEPIGGWDAFVDTGKTQEWTSRWYKAHVLAYDGRDTPNNDQPGTKFPFLVSNEWIESLKKTHGEDSWQLFQQGIGKPSRGMVSNRVITIGLCERNKAFEGVIWRDGELTKLYALDPAFGGGDRCVGGEITFGYDFNGKQIIDVSQPEIIPIRLNSSLEPEEQIAAFVKNKTEQLGIAPENIFYDSFGGGLLGFSFAKIFGANCPVPVNSGDKTTQRPVRFDLYVENKGEERRLKTCSEHYSKFVTEMWFSTREAIESQQVRNLPKSVADEGQLRLYRIVAGNRVEVESKDDMKERIRKSPDLYDWFAVSVEGARRKGFKIQRLGNEAVKKEDDSYEKESEALDKILHDELLVHS